MNWAGTSLPVLQWAYLGVWLINAVLVAGIVWRATRSTVPRGLRRAVVLRSVDAV